MKKKLILLYGALTKKRNEKYQKLMIEGGSVCGYRSYAERFGNIIYLSDQKVYKDWEFSMTNPQKVINFINKSPDAMVWAVKNDPNRDVKILRHIKNKKVYYSCCANNLYNKYCDVSLVDSKSRMGKNSKIWFKGKDKDFWKPVGNYDEFDYLLMGKRADKNELLFIKKLNKIKEKRRVLWIGGMRHKDKIDSIHDVVCTPFSGGDFVRDNISRAKVGILFTEHKAEGFPQSFLEMTMCGLPVVYNKDAPNNKYYLKNDNCVLTDRKNLIKNSEWLLKNVDHNRCRSCAIDNYSLDASYDNMVRILYGE
jgi:hypothetical protein